MIINLLQNVAISKCKNVCKIYRLTNPLPCTYLINPITTNSTITTTSLQLPMVPPHPRTTLHHATKDPYYYYLSTSIPVTIITTTAIIISTIVTTTMGYHF